MKTKERRKKILDLINELEKVSVESLAKNFNVSEMTIYRDLNFLEKEGYLKKTIGGAIKINDFLVSSVTTFAKRLKLHVKEKKAIAKRAVAHICSGDSIIIDAGTTGYYLVKEINNMNLSNLTVITNNIVSQIELKKNTNIEVIATGGTIKYDTYSSVGVLTEKLLKDILVDKVFITTKGITEDGILSDPSIEEGRIKELFLERGREKILIFDSSKFGVVGLYKFSSISDFDVIITDSNIQEKYLKMLKKSNVLLEITEV